MKGFQCLFFTIIYMFAYVYGATRSDNIIEQGLYRQSDHVVILAQQNFDKKVYGRNHAWVVQFYNSFCGHCKAFSSRYKALALDIINWKNAVQLAVVDCSVEENIGLCRDFEVLAYPSLRYLHENYVKGNGNIGEQMHITDTAEKLKAQLVKKLQNDQSSGRLQHIPQLSIASYASYVSALSEVPDNIIYTFLVFENANSTIGSELILDTLDYENIAIKRVNDKCELAEIAEVKQIPGLVAVRSTLEPTLLTPKLQTKIALLNAINTFLKSKHYTFPSRDIQNNEDQKGNTKYHNLIKGDVIFYSDLENTIRNSLHTEVVRYKVIEGDSLQAFINYLDVLIANFPFKANGSKYMNELRSKVLMRNKWNGNELYDLIKRLEQENHPVYSSQLQYVACRGSESKYRGYPCGLWTLFHTLTVNAAQNNNSGPKVLRSMLGYIKYFFGCSECSKHFQEMAARNRIFEVKENDKAVLWLWISHNEVNLRLAGDITEDPAYPKIQFPSTERCPNCRLVHGAWNLTAVYHYLQMMYSAENIQEYSHAISEESNSSPLSNVDIYLLSLLYLLSFIILIVIIKLFLTKRLYRKRVYKHDGWGKV